MIGANLRDKGHSSRLQNGSGFSGGWQNHPRLTPGLLTSEGPLSPHPPASPGKTFVPLSACTNTRRPHISKASILSARYRSPRAQRRRCLEAGAKAAGRHSRGQRRPAGYAPHDLVVPPVDVHWALGASVCQGPGGIARGAAATSDGRPAARARSSAGPSPPSASPSIPAPPLGLRGSRCRLGRRLGFDPTTLGR